MSKNFIEKDKFKLSFEDNMNNLQDALNSNYAFGANVTITSKTKKKVEKVAENTPKEQVEQVENDTLNVDTVDNIINHDEDTVDSGGDNFDSADMTTDSADAEDVASDSIDQDQDQDSDDSAEVEENTVNESESESAQNEGTDAIDTNDSELESESVQSDDADISEDAVNESESESAQSDDVETVDNVSDESESESTQSDSADEVENTVNESEDESVQNDDIDAVEDAINESEDENVQSDDTDAVGVVCEPEIENTQNDNIYTADDDVNNGLRNETVQDDNGELKEEPTQSNNDELKDEPTPDDNGESEIILPKIEVVGCTGTCSDCPSQSSCAQSQTDGEEYLLQVKNVKEYFPIKTSIIKKKNVYLKAVDGVSFNLKQGKTIGIVGESGCGKTTLGRTILRLYTPTAGEIIFDGKHIEKLKGEALRKMRPHFQMIFQDPYSSLSPRMTVGEIVGEAVKTHKIVPKSEYKDYIVDIMKKCGLQPHYFGRYPHEFSGGQRQRICIAKALALKPKLVICDEPVSALDVSIQAQVINLFKDLQESDNLAYIFISHDLSVVEHISDEVGVMYLGNMVELGSKKDLFSNPMHPYTEALFSAVPIPDPDTKIKRIILQGDIPSPAHPPKGCKFHTRCSKCMDICSQVEPVFKDYGDGHYVACHLYPQD